MRLNLTTLGRLHRRRLLFVATVVLPVFLFVYSEYINSKAAKRDQRNERHSIVHHALSSFNDRGKSAKRGEFYRPAFSSSVTEALIRQQEVQVHFSSTSRLSITERKNFSLPPLHTILAPNGTIIGDPQVLLHYAIIGFGKCGTTSMMRLLESHEGLQSLESEVWALIEHNPARLIERLHKKLADDLPRGYKCPGDILADYALDYYRQYWPQTRLIVGVRHPVLWFQSLYNFRVQHLEDFESMREPSELIGICSKAMKMICTKRGNFAWYLMHLGKQFLVRSENTSSVFPVRRRYSPLEKDIATFYERVPIYKRRIKPMLNPIFLFDVHQLGDANETRRAQFRRDVADFLGVDPKGFSTDLTADLNHVSPGRVWDAATQALKDEKKIDICHPQHVRARVELMKQARLSSRWIREVFLPSPGVHASSIGYLEELLLAWMDDPCGGSEAVVEVDHTASQEMITIESPFESSEYALPPYYSLFDRNDELIGDPQVLLYFSVIGFGKCGTTSLISWLGNHPELQTLESELWSLPMQKPSQLLTRLYQRLQKKLRRGYKCPGDVLSKYARSFYRRHLPRTKLFVGVRHPVLWFESLYNFRLQNLEDNESLLEPNSLIGLCRKSTKLVCTYRGNFGYHLLQFGKHVNATTRPFSPLEEQLATWYRRYSFGPSDIEPMPNEIFIFEVDQLADKDDLRRNRLRHDIQAYLALSQELPNDVTHYTPGRKWDEEVQAEKDKRKMNICDDEHLPLRAELMLQARTSSLWIRQVFLDSPGVHVSSRSYFEALLERWMHDPCNNKTDGIEAPSMVRNRVAQNKLALRRDKVDDERPPLSSILGDNGTISSDVQFLLDFAIVGFGRCGTTSVLHWLSAHRTIRCLENESRALMHGEPQKLVTRLYEELPAGRDLKRCHKCSVDVTEPHIIDYYRTLWPKTKLIVGVRHPVLWFQSLYNSRLMHLPDSDSMPHPNRLIGLCYKDSKMTCTRRGHFALSLLRLGKQYRNGTARPFTDLEERIVSHYTKHRFEPEDVSHVPNPVFIYDVSQLAPDEEDGRKAFAEDLADFLGIEDGLPEVPLRIGATADPDAGKAKRQINICDDEYAPVRNELLELARLSSRWIREEFLDSPGVFYASSRESMERTFLAWMRDPCDSGATVDVS